VFSKSVQIHLPVTVQGQGTVTSEPAGILCPNDCIEGYSKGTVVTLTAIATADSDSSFIGWDGVCIDSEPSCTFEISELTSVTAIFGTPQAVEAETKTEVGIEEKLEPEPEPEPEPAIQLKPEKISNPEAEEETKEETKEATKASEALTNNSEKQEKSIPKIEVEPVTKTGQTTCYDIEGLDIACKGSGQDGETLAGINTAVMRFIDNQDGTVTDTLTELTWLKASKCTFLNDPDGAAPANSNWQTALTQIAALENGKCGLLDNSVTGDWKMPNINQLLSLYNWESVIGTPTEHPFDNNFNVRYWSSTSNASGGYNAWFVQYGSSISSQAKTYTAWAWAVKK
jgi:hypothetical protein